MNWEIMVFDRPNQFRLDLISLVGVDWKTAARFEDLDEKVIQIMGTWPAGIAGAFSLCRSHSHCRRNKCHEIYAS